MLQLGMIKLENQETKNCTRTVLNLCKNQMEEESTKLYQCESLKPK